MSRALPEPVRRSLDITVAQKQSDWRASSVAAAVVRGGDLVWSGGAGHAVTAQDGAPGAPPTDDTQYRIGSITKNFTATLVMQCRDDGLLDLDEPIERHLPGTAHGTLTPRRMLSHLSGLQREPVGDIWELAEGPDLETMLAGLEQAEAVLPPSRRHHYSNLAFALLGEVVSRLRGQPWEDALRERILLPLGMTRTTPRRTSPAAVGYFTDPYADRLHVEPEFPGNAFAPAGELWSTPRDLARWAAFLADPDADVLSSGTLDEMCHPQVMYDLDGWVLGWGLGLMLHRRGERVLVGHDGAMPGFLAGLAVRRPEKVGAVVMANTSSGADPGGLAVELALRVVDDDPEAVPAWTPGPAVPTELAELTGVWWSEGTQFVFSVRDGALEAQIASAVRARNAAVFAPEGTDRFRVVSGREQGEVLRVVRDEHGAVARLYWATYPFTRTPSVFGG